MANKPFKTLNFGGEDTYYPQVSWSNVTNKPEVTDGKSAYDLALEGGFVYGCIFQGAEGGKSTYRGVYALGKPSCGGVLRTHARERAHNGIPCSRPTK